MSQQLSEKTRPQIMEYVQSLAYDLKREFELPPLSRLNKNELVALAKEWENISTADGLEKATGLPATGTTMTGARTTPPPANKKPKPVQVSPQEPQNEPKETEPVQDEPSGGRTNANPTCSRCGKALSNEFSVAAGMGPICEAHGGQSMAHEFTIETGSEIDTTLWMPFTEAYYYMIDQGIPGNRLIKASGGEAVIHEPYGKVWEPMYVGRRKYISRNVLFAENVQYLKDQGWKNDTVSEQEEEMAKVEPEEKAMEAANKIASRIKVRRKM